MGCYLKALHRYLSFVYLHPRNEGTRDSLDEHCALDAVFRGLLGAIQEVGVAWPYAPGIFAAVSEGGA